MFVKITKITSPAMKNIAFSALSMICLSCFVPKIELSEKEKMLENELKKKFACDEIDFRHDFDAVDKNTKNGIFMVTLCDEFCNKDSLTLCKDVIRLTNMIKPILSHKSNYEGVTFYMNIVVKDKKIDGYTSQCSKTITISMKDLKVTEFSR